MLDAVIFDMDGVLIDSERWWQEVEHDCFASVGVHLDESDATATMGLRVDEVIAYWYARNPWPDLDPAALAAQIVEGVEARVLADGEPLPGVLDAVTACAEAGLPLGIASSSPPRLIAASLRRLGLTELLGVVCSAESEAYGKPHPAVYLTAATQLNVEPARCLVVEDSVNGMVAAKAARMRCVVVPEHPDPRFALADHVLPTLEELPVLLRQMTSE